MRDDPVSPCLDHAANLHESSWIFMNKTSLHSLHGSGAVTCVIFLRQFEDRCTSLAALLVHLDLRDNLLHVNYTRRLLWWSPLLRLLSRGRGRRILSGHDFTLMRGNPVMSLLRNGHFLQLRLQFWLLVDHETMWYWLTVWWPGFVKMPDVILLLFFLSHSRAFCMSAFYMSHWFTSRADIEVILCQHVLARDPISALFNRPCPQLSLAQFSIAVLLAFPHGAPSEEAFCLRSLVEAVGTRCFWAPSLLMDLIADWILMLEQLTIEPSTKGHGLD